jgi:predicted Zn-ribbon and HTH transcriptional regulator
MSITEILLLQCVCEKCGHAWITRTQGTPKICPECKSVRWNEEKVKETEIIPIDET